MLQSDVIIIWLIFLQMASFISLILLKQIFKNLSEKVIIAHVVAVITTSILLILPLIFTVINNAHHEYVIDVGTWFGKGAAQYEIIFILDALAVIYSLFSTIMIGLIAIFSRRYLHKESGYFRFYVCLILFLLGVNLISFSGTMEMIIIGWEFVGLASVLLVSFFNYRPTPVKNAFWIFINYRICDIGLFAAVILLHETAAGSHFQILQNAKWFGINAQDSAPIIGFLILFGVMGKSALFPFSGWLARAMEGPTPSSAIFYGAISIHFGPLLLLRCADLIAATPALAVTIIIVGFLTAFFGHLISRAQSDIKTMLAYMAVTQIGLIIIEIGLGLNVIALIHIVGHASFRVMQMLRAPSIIHDLRNIESMLGHKLLMQNPRKKYSKYDIFKYHLALELGLMDVIVKDYIIAAILTPFQKLDKLEKKWRNFLSK